jgi:Flp pilus assembly protein TadG
LGSREIGLAILEDKPMTRALPPTSSATHSREAVLRGEAGTELLEFALVLPLLLMLLLGVVWLGRAYNVYQSMTRAAREGARYAVLPNCATCGNAYADIYTASDACLTNPTSVFNSYVAPALTAARMNTSLVQSYCQQAIVLNPGSNASVRQCGVSISFTYPVQLAIPFTSLNAATINIGTQVRMRMENQHFNAATGTPTCP